MADYLTCNSCIHFNPETEECHLNPPVFFHAVNDETFLAEGGNIWGWRRPPVNPEDMACGSHCHD